MAKTDDKSVAAYVAAQPAAARSVLARVRATIRKALPGATEGISYQIPIYKLDGKMVLYFAGFLNHYSIYPATARVITELKSELADRLHSKATIRFPLTEAIPTRLITRIAKLRAAEVAELQLSKRTASTAAKNTKSTSRSKSKSKSRSRSRSKSKSKSHRKPAKKR